MTVPEGPGRQAPALAPGPESRRRLVTFDWKITFLSLAAGTPAFLLAMFLLWSGQFDQQARWMVTIAITVLWFGMTILLRERLVRPIQTLSNVLAALRAGDFSIRTRVEAGTEDPLSLAFHEVNQLEEVLREQRLGAVEATALLQRVLEEIDVAVFAFDDDERLRLLNRAGERLLGQAGERVLGRTATQLRFEEALRGPAPRTVEINMPGGQGRWELKRTRIRQEGFPLRLLVLSDLSRALREEERQAWKRIIRVLSHEINNSLAPIKSIAGSLQTLLDRKPSPPDLETDLAGGLKVISGRSASLSRFMQSYAQLARLPQPDLIPMEAGAWVHRNAALETRAEVVVREGPEVTVRADPDQLDQLLINLIRNAVDAALETDGGVFVSWRVSRGRLIVSVEDEGPGLQDTANLFVPFYTTKPGGSGIGLALSQQIAEGHGGTLSLGNRKGGGAVAKLVIPLDPDTSVHSDMEDLDSEGGSPADDVNVHAIDDLA